MSAVLVSFSGYAAWIHPLTGTPKTLRSPGKIGDRRPAASIAHHETSRRMKLDEPDTEEQQNRKRARRTFWIRLIFVSFIVVALTRHVTTTKPRFVPIPMKPLEVAASATMVQAIPASPGALRGRDLILITLDSTRPDRLGCYGNRDIKTPTLDRLAAEGVIFSNAIATASTTLPTHASMFTGLYPHNHGVRTNGLYRLAEEQRTIAEILKEKGYNTAAFVSAFVLAKQFGLDQGFAHYDDAMGSSTTVGGYAERLGHHTTDRAIEWLGTKPSGPYFLWVHYYDPHQAHSPPSPFFEQNPHPYDGEVAFMDYELGLLLDKVKATSRDEPLIIVVADHGESLGEHGERTHGHLAYDATLRIPLIMHAPETLGGPHHISTRVSQVDLLPTIASLLDLRVPRQLDGLDLTRAPEPGRPMLAEAVEGQANFGWAGLAALYLGPLKYIEGPKPELYDLEQDPLEENNLYYSRQQAADELKQQLQALRGENARLTVPTTTDLDPADVARLEALGYVVTAGSQFEPGRNGPDPKTEMPRLREIFSALRKVQTGPPPPIWKSLLARIRGEVKSPEETIAVLEAMAAAHPDFSPVYRYLGFLYKMVDRPDQVARVKRLLEAKVRGREGD